MTDQIKRGRPHMRNYGIATDDSGLMSWEWVDAQMAQSRKARNFEHQPEIVVHLESGDDTVILEGKVEQVTDPAQIAPVDKLYAAKYPPFDPTPSQFYFVLRPHTALAWQEKDFPHTATCWDFD